MLRADAYLRTVPWFSELSAAQQEQALGCASLRVVAKGEYLARRGEVPCHWLGVAHGVLKASNCSVDGRASSRLLAATSGWAEAEELVQTVARAYDIVAMRDTVVVLIPAAIFRFLLASSTSFCRFILMDISRQHALRLHRLEAARLLPTAAFVAQTVSELAALLGSASERTVRLKQEDIAEFTGLARQTVNQALKALEGNGLLSTHYSRVEVHDFAALAEHAIQEATVT